MKPLCFCLTAVNMCLLISIHATADAQFRNPDNPFGNGYTQEMFRELRRDYGREC